MNAVEAEGGDGYLKVAATWGFAAVMRMERKRNRLGLEKYRGRGRFFVTTCCEGRREFLREADLAKGIIESLREQSDRCSFAVHAYCVMPDHMHFLAEGKSDTSDLIRFVKTFKQVTGYAYQGRIKGRLWQRSFYDHILRSGDSDEDVAWYIWMNPVRKGICGEPGEYAFSGSFSLPWPKSQPNELWIPPWKAKMAT